MPVRLRVHGPPRTAGARPAAWAILVRHEALRTVFAEAGGRSRSRSSAAPRPGPAGGRPPRPGPRRPGGRGPAPGHRARPTGPSTSPRDPSLRATLLAAGPTPSTSSWPPSTTSPPTAGRWASSSGSSALSTRPGATAGRPGLPSSRSSTATSPPGSEPPDASLAADLAYWREQLADLPPLRLPTDRPRPAVESFRGGRQSLEVPADVDGALLALGRRLEATPFMVCWPRSRPSWPATPARPASRSARPIANRTRGETEGLIGFFVNSLVFPADLAGDPRSPRWSAGSAKSALGAYAHQDLPFERLVEVLQPDRDLGRNPLFQVVFAFQQADAVQPDFALDGLRVSPWTPARWPSASTSRSTCGPRGTPPGGVPLQTGPPGPVHCLAPDGPPGPLLARWPSPDEPLVPTLAAHRRRRPTSRHPGLERHSRALPDPGRPPARGGPGPPDPRRRGPGLRGGPGAGSLTYAASTPGPARSLGTSPGGGWDRRQRWPSWCPARPGW